MKRIVVKLGTGILAKPGGRSLDTRQFQRLCDEFAALEKFARKRKHLRVAAQFVRHETARHEQPGAYLYCLTSHPNRLCQPTDRATRPRDRATRPDGTTPHREPMRGHSRARATLEGC